MNFFSEETQKQLNTATEQPDEDFVEFYNPKIGNAILNIGAIILGIVVILCIIKLIKGKKK